MTVWFYSYPITWHHLNHFPWQLFYITITHSIVVVYIGHINVSGLHYRQDEVTRHHKMRAYNKNVFQPFLFGLASPAGFCGVA